MGGEIRGSEVGRGRDKEVVRNSVIVSLYISKQYVCLSVCASVCLRCSI
jgi:hypothetical protein